MNAKIYTGNIQPNPKEYKIWVNDEGVIKTWNGTEWIEQSGESGGTASKYAPRYFTIDWDKADIGWRPLLGFLNDEINNEIYMYLSFAASVKIVFENRVVITSSIPNGYEMVTAFSFIPLYAPTDIGLGVDQIKTIEDYIIAAKFVLKNFVGVETNLSMDGITEITEEEFYKID